MVLFFPSCYIAYFGYTYTSSWLKYLNPCKDGLQLIILRRKFFPGLRWYFLSVTVFLISSFDCRSPEALFQLKHFIQSDISCGFIWWTFFHASSIFLSKLSVRSIAPRLFPAKYWTHCLYIEVVQKNLGHRPLRVKLKCSCNVLTNSQFLTMFVIKRLLHIFATFTPNSHRQRRWLAMRQNSRLSYLDIFLTQKGQLGDSYCAFPIKKHCAYPRIFVVNVRGCVLATGCIKNPQK